jgi:SAM-dependent methyltransferase
MGVCPACGGEAVVNGRHAYSSAFFDYIEQGAIISARSVIPVLQRMMEISNVVDVGCGRGAWLTVWKENSVSTVLGIDGDYLDIDRLLIDPKEFEARDLAAGFALQRRFDIATSFEVAEHMPPATSEKFVEGLVSLSDVVAFSAAVIGQGGENHVNERPLEFWRRLFRRHGYECYDCIRPAIKGDKAVMPWYRNNILVYANDLGRERMAPTVHATRLQNSEVVLEGGGIGWRVRRAIVNLLPRPVVTLIAEQNSLVQISLRRLKVYDYRRRRQSAFIPDE